MSATIPVTVTLDYSARHKLDIYLPAPDAQVQASKVGGLPTVIFFHGGGLVFGTREQNFIFPYWLLEQTLAEGWAFISADYSKLPAYTAHDMIDDVRAVLKFIASPELTQHLGGVHIDTTRLAVTGASAGAYIARLAVLYAEPKACALVSLYGMGGSFLLPHWTDIRTGDAVGPFLVERPTPFVKLFHEGNYIDLLTGVTGIADTVRNLPVGKERFAAIPDAHHRLFPELYTESFPPTLLVHGHKDSVVLVEESENTAAQLKSKGKEVQLIVVDGVEHGLLPGGPLAKQAEKDVTVFLRKYLSN